MAILKPHYSVATLLTITGLATLADTASLTESTEHNNSTDLFIDVEIQCQFTAAGTTTGSVDIYALTGLETGVLSSPANISNMRRLGSVELNGTTAVSKTLLLTDVPPFWKMHFINNSGAALTAANIKMLGVNFTDV